LAVLPLQTFQFNKLLRDLFREGFRYKNVPVLGPNQLVCARAPSAIFFLHLPELVW